MERKGKKKVENNEQCKSPTVADYIGQGMELIRVREELIDVQRQLFWASKTIESQNSEIEFLRKQVEKSLGIKGSDQTIKPTEKKQPTNKNRTYHLICTNVNPISIVDSTGELASGIGEGLEFLARYTSPGLVTEDGIQYYPINELNGETKFAERFQVYNPKKPRP
ncbi:hypothetical protein [Pollutibacter soli]|uniref:hypothetical protein n=1 Tax=Pollutibacter soli TaxID=3034157 RepID=UPI0030141C4A